MHRSILLLACISVFALPASAQEKVSSRKVCERRCNAVDTAKEPVFAPYEEKLTQIRQQKKLEADPKKRKALDADEERAIDVRKAAVETLCRRACSSNPED